MQVHGGDARRARAGTRTALNLGNLAVDELARGDVISRVDASSHKVVRSDRLLARVTQLGFGQRAWQRDTALQLCAGTASSNAHLVPLAVEDPDSHELLDPSPGAGKPTIAPGQSGLVRVYLDTPLAIWAGQRMILRALLGRPRQRRGAHGRRRRDRGSAARTSPPPAPRRAGPGLDVERRRAREYRPWSSTRAWSASTRPTSRSGPVSSSRAGSWPGSASRTRACSRSGAAATSIDRCSTS